MSSRSRMALAVGDWLVRVGRLFVALQRWGVWLLMLPLMPVLRWLWLVPPTHKPGRYWKHLGRHPVRDETPPRPEFPTRITAGRSGRKTLVLDLDETLIHSRVTRSPSSIACDLQLEVEIDRQMCRFYVHYRPYAELFLQTVRPGDESNPPFLPPPSPSTSATPFLTSGGRGNLLAVLGTRIQMGSPCPHAAQVARWYDVVVFTASLQEYGNPIIDSLDPDGSLVGRRFFRDSCRHDRDRNQFLKNLTKVQPDLANVMIIDNSPGAYKMQPG